MNCTMQRRYFRALSVLICPLLVLQTAIAGQTAGISILVVDGNRAQNLLSVEAEKPISVRIVDRAGVPLENASVLFVPPEFGPGGAFARVSGPVTVTTNRQGLAVAPPFIANASAGDYEIQVIASYMGQVTRVLLEQSNVEKRKGSNKKLFIISALVGGAAVAAFAASGGSDDPTTPAPTRNPTAPPIVFLNSSVGAPQ